MRRDYALFSCFQWTGLIREILHCPSKERLKKLIHHEMKYENYTTEKHDTLDQQKYSNNLLQLNLDLAKFSFSQMICKQ